MDPGEAGPVSQSELLKKTIGALNSSQIPYMLTGSIASSIQGEPRSTHDTVELLEKLTREAAIVS